VAIAHAWYLRLYAGKVELETPGSGHLRYLPRSMAQPLVDGRAARVGCELQRKTERQVGRHCLHTFATHR
jgi:hypothetical protein